MRVFRSSIVSPLESCQQCGPVEIAWGTGAVSSVKALLDRGVPIAQDRRRERMIRATLKKPTDAAILEASHQIMRQIPVPLLGIDDDGLIVFSNFAAERLFGNGMTLMGCTTAQALPPALVDAHHAADSTRLHFDVSGQRFEARLQSFAGSLAQGAAILCAYPIGESA